MTLFDGWGEKDSDISLVVHSGGEQKVLASLFFLFSFSELTHLKKIIKFYENSQDLSKSRTPLYGPYHVSSEDSNLFLQIDVPNLKAGMTENSWIVWFHSLFLSSVIIVEVTFNSKEILSLNKLGSRSAIDNE